MKKGDRVKIYQDPLTKKKFEGDAVLVKRFGNSKDAGPNYKGCGLEYWEVKFSDGDIVLRGISTI